MESVCVDEENDGQRLDIFLTGLPGINSRETAGKIIRAGAMTIDGKKGSFKLSRKVVAGEILLFEIPSPPETNLTPEHFPLEIHFEDEHLIVLFKPCGIVTHPSPGHSSGTLVHFLLGRGSLSEGYTPERPGIVHRLDKDTSGLMIVTKTPQAQIAMSDKFKNSEVRKKYVVIVKGKVRGVFGAIDKPIGDHPRDPRRKMVHPEGRPSVTKWKLILSEGPHSLLVCEPLTGRTHQIRVHMLSEKIPVLNDSLYNLGNFSSVSKPGHFLHACGLAFDHPISGKRLSFYRRPPARFRTVLEKNRLRYDFDRPPADLLLPR